MTNHIECCAPGCDYAGPGFSVVLKSGRESFCNHCIRRELVKRVKDKKTCKKIISAIQETYQEAFVDKW